MVSQDPRMQNLTPEQKNGYISALAQDRDVKQHGVRANNAAAARDVLATTDRITREVSPISLSLRVLPLSIMYSLTPSVNEQEYMAHSLSHEVTSMIPSRVCGTVQTIQLHSGRMS